MASLRVIAFNSVAVLSLAFLLGIPLYAAFRSKTARNWRRANGYLISVYPLQVDYREKHFLYEAKCNVHYEYVINGTRYVNNLVTFLDILGFFFVSNGYYRELHTKLVSAFEKRNPIAVFYNHKNPAQAVLTPNLSWQLIAGYLFGALIIAGGWLVAQPMLAYLANK
jgi:hypothetical protein